MHAGTLVKDMVTVGQNPEKEKPQVAPPPEQPEQPQRPEIKPNPERHVPQPPPVPEHVPLPPEISPPGRMSFATFRLRF
jgi:hypothetical protein